MQGYYKEHRVWKRAGKKLILFRCFENLSTGLFGVQSSDCFTASGLEANMKFLERQFLELLMDEKPERRTKFFESLEGAIRHHEQCFFPDANS